MTYETSHEQRLLKHENDNIGKNHMTNKNKFKQMKNVLSVALLVLGISHFTANAQNGDLTHTKENGNRYLPGIEIPVSALASEELQKHQAYSPFQLLTDIPETTEGWLELQKSMNGVAAKKALGLATAFGIEVETKTIAGTPVRYVRPPTIADKYANSMFVHTHGGAFVFNGGDASVFEAVVIAAKLQIEVISIDYRKPPLHPFPAGLNDAVATVKEIQNMYPNRKIFMGGTSAGGNITMATTLKLKDEGHKLPDAIFLGTPGIVFKKEGDSFYTNEGLDKSLGTWDGFVTACLELYADGTDFDHPYIAPIHGDLTGFPPTFLVSGTRDLLMSATVVAHRRLRDAGATADLVIIEGHSHGEYLFPAPERVSVYKDMDMFFSQYAK